MNTSSALQNITGTIALAGAGKMGGAMLTGWLAQAARSQARRGDRAASVRRDQRAGGQGHSPQSRKDDGAAVDTLVVAVKPQIVPPRPGPR